jgi:lipopolysaccharide heptosyltransferase II
VPRHRNMALRDMLMCGDNPWHQARKILCVRLDGMGDVLMTTPAIRALKESAPGRRITLLTSAAGAAVAALVPEIDDIVVYDAPWLKGSTLRDDSERDRAMADQLRGAGFDGAVIFTVYSQSPLPSAFLTYMAEIPLRLAHSRENPYQLLTDWIPETEPDRQIRHEVQRQLDLVAAVGAQAGDAHLSLAVPSAAHARVRQLLAERIQPSEPWVLIHPGASAQSRRYPPENFALAARRLTLDHNLKVVFAGAGSEVDLVGDIQTIMRVPSHSLAGCLDLAETAALIAQAPVLVANNSGPAHIAAAVGTPVVDLYALTNPQHTPWAVANRVLNHDVPCKFCYKSVCPQGHHDCLRKVDPETVVQATLELLREMPAQDGGQAQDLDESQ